MDGLLYFFTVLAFIQAFVSLKDGISNFRYSRKYICPVAPDRRVVVFCPVKGMDAEIEANIESLFGQTHTDYRIVFIVDSDDDPAFPVLSRTEADVWVAGPANDCGQKVHSLSYAVRSIGDRGEIFVFCDADARFPSHWLRDLVAPLEDAGVGATTGYRWYVPPGSSFPSLLGSAWNATIAGFLGPHRNNFVWGGSTGIRREVFEVTRVLESWAGALSDDYALTAAVRASNLRIRYVPTCLVPSYQEFSWAELFEFTTRQVLITRVYAPRIWGVALVSYTLFNLTFFWILFRMFEQPVLLPFWIALYGMGALRADLRLRAAAVSIPERPSALHRWFYRLSSPLVALLYEWNLLASMLGRRLVWKGIRYKLISSRETRIET